MHMSDKNIRREEAANALRTVTPDRAFCFYREIRQPLGATSRNLDEFVTVVEDIDPSSIRFHVERGDFGRWFRMLGAKSLAGQVASLGGKNSSPDELRKELSSIVRTHVDQLHRIASSK